MIYVPGQYLPSAHGQSITIARIAEELIVAYDPLSILRINGHRFQRMYNVHHLCVIHIHSRKL